MPKIEKDHRPQLAKCLTSKKLPSKPGDTEARLLYEFALVNPDGSCNPRDVFTVFPREDFVPEVGRTYTPVVFVYAKGYKGNNDNIYVRNEVGVGWEVFE